ncbi:hypothetical protein PMIN06_012584, partial [Paraphaeosphaeria minitans]
LCISIFLATLDSTIVNTALISITDSLKGFDQSSWLVNAYLLTYTGFLVIASKLSDIFGRRAIIAASLVLFTIASICCGVAQTLAQLIVFRAFQGIGGAGLYTMVLVVLPEMCTPAQYPLYSTIVSMVSVFSSLLGPILGGAISQKLTWRWIFFLNIPPGILALGLLYTAIPSHFPHSRPSDALKMSMQSIRRLDIIGTVLLLAATTLFLLALEENSIGHSWTNAIVVSPLVASLVLWCAFFGWSKYQASRNTVQEPVLPWRVLKNRFCLALFFNAFWTGCLLYSAVFTLPQMFQIVHKTSSITTGYWLLPLTLSVPVGSAVSATLMAKNHVPPFYLILIGSILQALGIGLMTWLPIGSEKFLDSGYGFEAICGFGIGVSTAVSILTAMLVFEKEDLSVGMGWFGQFRSLGGCVGVSVCINIMNKYITSQLASELSLEQMAAVKLSASAVNSFPKAIQIMVRGAYAGGFLWQSYAMMAFGSVAILTVLLMVEKNLRKQM